MPAVPLPSNGPASHAPKASADITLVLGAFPRLRPLGAGPRASPDPAGRVPLTLPSYPAGLAFLRHTLISARLPRVPGEPPRLGSEGSRGEGGRRLPGRPWRRAGGRADGGRGTGQEMGLRSSERGQDPGMRRETPTAGPERGEGGPPWTGCGRTCRGDGRTWGLAQFPKMGSTLEAQVGPGWRGDHRFGLGRVGSTVPLGPRR